MKTFIFITALLILVPPLAWSQEASHPPHGQGYGIVGAGSHQMGLNAGFGAEGYIYKGLGMGLEAGGVGLTGDDNKMTGVASADTSYHFFPKKIRGNAAPFVSGGYTAFFGHNTHTGTGFGGHKPLMTQGFNIGAGVDVFASKHTGVRFDVRYYGHGGRILNYIFPDVDQFSFVAFRIGLTFR